MPYAHLLINKFLLEITHVISFYIGVRGLFDFKISYLPFYAYLLHIYYIFVWFYSG